MIQIEIPQFESHYVLSKKRRAKYRTLKDGTSKISNSKYAGKPRLWRVNGQDMYNGRLNPLMRAKITKYYHDYLIGYIHLNFVHKHITSCTIKDFPISISLDIFEIKDDKMPDIDNLWIWKKWFSDCLTELEIIPDDGPDYIIESGYIKYHWVTTEEERKLIFNIY